MVAIRCSKEEKNTFILFFLRECLTSMHYILTAKSQEKDERILSNEAT